jgi:hypothetical protein
MIVLIIISAYLIIAEVDFIFCYTGHKKLGSTRNIIKITTR